MGFSGLRLSRLPWLKIKIVHVSPFKLLATLHEVTESDVMFANKPSYVSLAHTMQKPSFLRSAGVRSPYTNKFWSMLIELNSKWGNHFFFQSPTEADETIALSGETSAEELYIKRSTQNDRIHVSKLSPV